MLKRALSALMFVGLCGSSEAAVFKGDTADDPPYREIIGRVFRLKAPFRVYAHAIEGGRGPTAYRYTMEILSGWVMAGDNKTVFWGTIPEGTHIKIVAVWRQSFDSGYSVELLGPKDERFEGLKLEIIERPLLPAYVKSEASGEIRQLRPMWFEEVADTTE